MARKAETARLSYRKLAPSSTLSSPASSSHLHVDFMEVRVHTAKCDSCETHNKLTMYRCLECGQHVCSLCWNKSGDGTHVFGGEAGNVPGVNTNGENEENNEDRAKQHGNAVRTRDGRRVHVISDDEDDDFPMLTSAFTTEVTDASNQHQEKTNVVMNGDHHQDHGDDLPGLWPIASSGGPPVLRPTVPIVNTSAIDNANRKIQRNFNTHGDEDRAERRSIIQVHDNSGRQTVETNFQARRLPQSSLPHQQAIRSVPAHLQPAVYRPQAGVDVDRQAAPNQFAYPNHQPPQRQVPRPAQPPTAHHQQAPHRMPPAIYRPKPRVDVDKQAALNQTAFAPRPHGNHQIRRPSQVSASHQQTYPAPRPAQASIPVSEQRVQAAADLDQVASQALYLQRAQACANANYARQIEARNQHFLSPLRNVRLAANRDQVAAHNQHAYISNQLSPSATGYEQMLAAHDCQQAYLSRQQANLPSPGSAQTSISHQRAAHLSRSPSQTFLSHQHGPERDPESHYSPEVVEAADALLRYAGVDQNPGDPDANSDPHTQSAADRPENTEFSRSGSRLSSKTSLGRSGAAGTQSMSPRDSISNPTPLPKSDHAATDINEWDSGRAAPSSGSRSATIDAAVLQLDHNRSAVPSPYLRSPFGVPDITNGRIEPAHSADASTQTPNTSISLSGELNDADVIMGDLKAETPEDGDSDHSEARALDDKPWTVEEDRGAEKRSRSEGYDDSKTSKEHKRSSDLDLVDTRKGSGEEELPLQIKDDANDVEITSWKEVNSNEAAKNHGGAAKESKPDRVLRRGVAHVKKPVRKGWMGKKSATAIG